MSNFELKTDFDIFKATVSKDSSNEISNIDIKNLVHYKNHPFKLYKGERFNDMVSSIKTNGILSPLIVRPFENDNFNYEILSGHNRFESAKVAGLLNVPCLIKENLTDEESLLIVTETNLIQRSFTDLSHSERASSLSVHYEAIKKQGKRNDLINEIESILSRDDCDAEENSTFSSVNKNLKTQTIVGQNYGLSRESVARYLRINELILEFKELIDDDLLPLIAGVNLSYIDVNGQKQIYDYISENNFKININHSEKLKGLHKKDELTHGKIKEIFLGKKISKPEKPKSIIKVARKKLTNYFNENETEETIEETIVEALEFYFEHKDEFADEGGDINE